jgi:hypothetical protein
LRRVSFFSAGLFTIAGLCLAAAVAIVWRETSETDYDKNARIAITADFVAQCQTDKPQCADMVTDAMRWEVDRHRITRSCLSGRPGARTMAHGTVTWLNAHVEKHPLSVEQGIADAADAVWPCGKSGG